MMTAERTPDPMMPIVTERSLAPSASLKAMPEIERWICDGRRRDGGPCGAVLMELRLGEQGRVRIKCPRCGTWHTRQE